MYRTDITYSIMERQRHIQIQIRLVIQTICTDNYTLTFVASLSEGDFSRARSSSLSDSVMVTTASLAR